MSCWRHAALMRTIQSRRNSPLRARRSRKAYAPERMTCSFALRKLRLLAPEYPWAASKTARRCFLAWTERLTRAMTPLLLLPRLRPARTLPRRRAVDSSSAVRLCPPRDRAASWAEPVWSLSGYARPSSFWTVSYTHLRAHETVLDL